jgi:uncharacterized protein (TIGR02611 family)
MKWISRTTTALGLKNLPFVRKVVIGVIGTTIVLFGVALIVLPGPALVVIPLGIAILASEFAWARRALRRGRLFVGRIRRGPRVKIRRTART